MSDNQSDNNIEEQIDSNSVEQESIEPESIEQESIEQESIDPESVEQESIEQESIDPESVEQESATSDSIEAADNDDSENIKDQLDTDLIERVLESALFCSADPLTVDQCCRLFADGQVSKSDCQAALSNLQENYKERAVSLQHVASGWRFQADTEYAPYLSRLWEKKPPKYSRAVMETLALIIYRQPITRAEIEDVRGVAVSTQIVKGLMERGWIKIVGRRDVPGKPALFGTTKTFLDHFGMQKLTDLPELPEPSDLEQKGKELKEQLELLGFDDASVSLPTPSEDVNADADAEMLNEDDEGDLESEKLESEDFETDDTNNAENISEDAEEDFQEIESCASDEPEENKPEENKPEQDLSEENKLEQDESEDFEPEEIEESQA